MKYVCYECDKRGIETELSKNIDERFISIDGKCLCNKCSVGVERATERQIQLIKEYKSK